MEDKRKTIGNLRIERITMHNERANCAILLISCKPKRNFLPICFRYAILIKKTPDRIAER